MEISILFPSDPDSISEKDLSQIHPYSTYNSQTHRRREVWSVVAMSPRGAIGREGDLPWHLPEDLKHFKELTMGHPVIMGRKTWESLPRRPLPGRRNIVISRNPDYPAEGAEVFESLEAAVEACREIPFVIGGEMIYRLSIPLLTRIYITEVEKEVEDADAFFPTLNEEEWEISDKGDILTSSKGTRYRFLTKLRK